MSLSEFHFGSINLAGVLISCHLGVPIVFIRTSCGIEDMGHYFTWFSFKKTHSKNFSQVLKPGKHMLFVRNRYVYVAIVSLVTGHAARFALTARELQTR